MYVKIPLLQDLHDVPIYAKTIRDLVVKKLGRKPKDPPIVHVVGKLFEIMMGRDPLAKYDDPVNPTIRVYIGNTHIPNILVDLGAAINVMTIEIVKKLGPTNLMPTDTILEMADRSMIKPEGILDDLVVSVDSWECPA